jgi:hypothetical protein
MDNSGNGVQVRKVVRDHKKAIEVEIQAGNVMIIFKFKNGKLSYQKYKPETRIYDPAQLWVPPILFKEACRQAAGILRSKSSKLTSLKKQTTLPF